MTRTTYTVTVHCHLDPACRLYDGHPAPFWLRWMFRCDGCRAAVSHPEPSETESGDVQ